MYRNALLFLRGYFSRPFRGSNVPLNHLDLLLLFVLSSIRVPIMIVVRLLGTLIGMFFCLLLVPDVQLVFRPPLVVLDDFRKRPSRVQVSTFSFVKSPGVLAEVRKGNSKFKPSLTAGGSVGFI